MVRLLNVKVTFTAHALYASKENNNEFIYKNVSIYLNPKQHAIAKWKSFSFLGNTTKLRSLCINVNASIYYTRQESGIEFLTIIRNWV